MKLSWNEIRARASHFATEWAGCGYEKGETQLFYRDFFSIFGMNVRRLGAFELHVNKLKNERGFLDFFWPGMLLIEQKSKGRKLVPAKEQALNYFSNLKDSELPKYLLLSDFASFELYDLDKSAKTPIAHFKLELLPEYIEFFNFIRGDVLKTFLKQEKVSIKASDLMASLHDLLKADGFASLDLQILLVRLVFCFFADDTGIFPKHTFLNFIKNRTDENGDNLGRILHEIFEVLNTKECDRQKSLDSELNEFPYINGDLFSQNIRTPTFNKKMRNTLLAAQEFDWSDVSPTIFGSLFQGVMKEVERRNQGVHYTSEKNILKIVGPLFLEELQNEFQTIARLKKGRSQKLMTFHEKISSFRFFDPACGCGNFLAVAYKFLRELETQILQILHDDEQQYLNVELLSKINVDKFYGIEIDSFAAKIAEISLWMTDHLCNIHLGNVFGKACSRIPLVTSPSIVCRDALETDWNDVIIPAQCTFILGNPPFGGAKPQGALKLEQTKKTTDSGTLDYVSSWFIKSGEYVEANNHIKVGLVSTNSIIQGEQVAQLWPILLGKFNLEIFFAHQTFRWKNESKKTANVHVVITGLVHKKYAPIQKRLFSYKKVGNNIIAHETQHEIITPYFQGGVKSPNTKISVKSSPRSLMGYPAMKIGSQPIDDNNYIFTEEQKKEFLKIEPQAKKFIRPYMGGDEFLNGYIRYILNLKDASPNDIAKMPEVRKRIELVREHRFKSRRKDTLKIASTPTIWNITTIPKKPYLIIPCASSETREYIPIAYMRPPVIPSNAVQIMLDAQIWHFAILTSQMHMAWMRRVAGRLKSDYRYSSRVVYNPFPWPTPDGKDLKENIKLQEKLEGLAQNIIDIRAKYHDCSLATLYNPTSMPPDLKRAHIENDKYVDSLYRKAPFKDDRGRVEHLFELYQKLIKAVF